MMEAPTPHVSRSSLHTWMQQEQQRTIHAVQEARWEMQSKPHAHNCRSRPMGSIQWCSCELRHWMVTR